MAKKETHFGNTVADILQSKNMTQTQLAGNTASGSAVYVNHLVNGRKIASPGWAETIATALAASEEERKRLHIAAALDKGYKIDSFELDFTPPKKRRKK